MVYLINKYQTKPIQESEQFSVLEKEVSSLSIVDPTSVGQATVDQASENASAVLVETIPEVAA